MKFEIDKQTLKDLEIFGNGSSQPSVFSLFNSTTCLGGKQKLYQFLINPLTDIDAINERKEMIAYFQKHFSAGIQIDKNALDFTEYYYRHASHAPRVVSKFTAIERKILDKIAPSPEYYMIEKGVESVLELLKDIDRFAKQVYAKREKGGKGDCPQLLAKDNDKALAILSQPKIMDIVGMKKIKAQDISRLDYLFRRSNRQDILFFLDMIYQYDALLSVAKTAEEHGLSYPEVSDNKEHGSEKKLQIDGLFHPLVQNAIPCDIHFDRSENLLFVSGPNMAGKSTFLKALGIAVYLAHLGFPVPAHNMKVNLLSGVCTTINISDDLSSGYSHFYAEVMRIKNVVSRLRENNNMLVIFDELFRGTNVKDAFDGTLAVVSALSKIETSFFVISTHIVEVAKELEDNPKIKFSYIEVDQKNGYPIYTYKLRDGVSDIRLGMYIINKEQLIENINDITRTRTIKK